MAELATESAKAAALIGSFTVWSVPATVPYDEVLSNLGEPVLDAKNLVVNTALTALIQLLRGDTANYLPTYITIGSGGDVHQTTKLDTGTRVAATVSDTAVRLPVARIPISLTEDGPELNSWYYVAIARPHEALAPIINELGVETRNGTLMSHYISDADSTGRATKYTKTALEYLVIRWKYQLSLLANAVIEDDSGPLEGLYVPFTLGNGTVIYTLLVEPRAGASTTQAILSQTSNGTFGTVDVQNNGTITSQTSDGTPATIGTEEV